MSLAARALRPIVEIRPHEVRRALLLTSDLFVRLLAYYLLKASREVLILGAPGARAEIKTYSSAAQGLLLIILALAFGAFSARVRRRTLLIAVNTFFALQLVLFAFLFHFGGAHELVLAIIFFIWLGCFNLLMVAQFWSFANDLYTRADGERLFPLVALGGSLGAAVGAQLAKMMLRGLGIASSLLTVAMLLMVSLLFAMATDHGATQGGSAPPVRGLGGMTLLKRDHYLGLIGLLVLFKNWLNAFGEYVLDRRLLEVAHHAPTRAAAQAYIAGFKSDYLTYATLFAVVAQLVLVSRTIRRFGVGRSLCVLPFLVVLGYSTSLATPTLGLLLAVKIGENGTDYSLQKTAEQSLYLVTARSAKYKVKAIIETVFVRFGDVLAAILVAALLARSVSFRGILSTSIVLGLATLSMSLMLMHMHRARAVLASSTPAIEPGALPELPADAVREPPPLVGEPAGALAGLSPVPVPVPVGVVDPPTPK